MNIHLSHGTRSFTRANTSLSCGKFLLPSRVTGVHSQGLNNNIFFRFVYFLNFFFSTFFIYFWDRERQSMNGGGAEREGDTESETGSRLRAISPEPDAGLELTDLEIVTWLKSDAQPTAPPRPP